MGFLRKLFGGGTNREPAMDGPAAPRPKPTPPTWTIPLLDERHPNAPDDGPLPPTGAPERNRFVVPAGIAVLNAKTRNVLHAIRLNGTGSTAAQEALVSLVSARTNAADLVPCELRTQDRAVALYCDEVRLGTLPTKYVERFGPLVAEADRTGWRLVTWVDVLPPTDSIAEGASRSGPGLVAEARLPVLSEPLFADAYDASFAFPYKQVFARRKTAEGKAEFEAWWAANAVKREFVTVHIGERAIRAARLDWAAARNGEIEGRGFRLMDPATSAWLYEELPDELTAAGVRIVEVAGVSRYADRSASAFAAGEVVSLVPEPDNPHDRNAVAVRSADGKLQAGHLPRETAAWATEWMRRTGEPFSGLVLWEFRLVGGTDRRGLRLLIAPAPISVTAEG